MPIDTVVLIPESTRKSKGGDPSLAIVDSFLQRLPVPERAKLRSLREMVVAKSGRDMIAAGGLLPAYRRFQGNMYRRIPQEAWERRAAGVEVLIASGLAGLVASNDTVPAYAHSMAEPTPPFGKLNRWWHEQGLAPLLAVYLRSVRPKTVVDLLSHEYREAVEGYAATLRGVEVKVIDFPGLGRASQPRRGELVAKILQTGTLL